MKQIIIPMKPTTTLAHTTKLKNPTEEITQTLGRNIESCKFIIRTTSRKTAKQKTTKMTILIQTANPVTTTPTSKTTNILKDIQTILPPPSTQQQIPHQLDHKIILLKTADRPKMTKTNKIALEEEADAHAYDRNNPHNLYKKII